MHALQNARKYLYVSIKVDIFVEFSNESWASFDSDQDITNNAMQVRIQPWT